MPVGLQTRLLRVLEDGRVRRIGGEKDIAVDVRVVAATARDLDRAVREGGFREDLLYRLNVVHVRIPPLRERAEDIPLLAEELVGQAAARLGRPVHGIEPAAMEALLSYPWPGNVRQLENALERAVLVTPGPLVRRADLPPEVLGSPAGDAEPAEDAEEVLSIKVRTAELERELIAKALARTGGNRTRAARLLEISTKALAYKIRGYGLE